MLLTSLFAEARALCRARGKSGRGVGAARKRPGARRATFERLESREVLSSFSPIPGVVVASVGATTSDSARDSFLDFEGKILVAGASRSSVQDFAALRFQADGTLDSTFGTGGIVVTRVGPYGSVAFAAVGYPASPADKIVLAGTAPSIPKRGSIQADFALARYNADGSLDSTFNYKQVTKKSATFGTVQTDLGGGGGAWQAEYITDALVQPDGKIVAGGVSDASGAERFTLARYTAAGKLDTTFGVGGAVTTSFGGTLDRAAAVTLHQGNILAVGTAFGVGVGPDFALARYTSNGSLDTSFGAGGKVVTDFGESDKLSAVAIDADDTIVVIGNAPQGGICRFGLARYLPNGSLDASFGTGGRVQSDLGHEGPVPSDVAIDPRSRKIVAVGTADDRGGEFLVARFNADGSLDSTFGTGGVVFTAIPNLSARAKSVLIQPDGKIVVSGDGFDLPYVSPGHYRIALARYDTYGNLDPSFGASGAASASSESPAALTDAALADTGRQQLALAALMQYEDQLQAKPARGKGLAMVPAVDLALAELGA